MDDLTYTLRTLCQRNRDGSHATQADRLRTLTLASRQLREAGFLQMTARSLKGRHVDVLRARWQGEGLSAALRDFRRNQIDNNRRAGSRRLGTEFRDRESRGPLADHHRIWRRTAFREATCRIDVSKWPIIPSSIW